MEENTEDSGLDPEVIDQTLNLCAIGCKYYLSLPQSAYQPFVILWWIPRLTNVFQLIQRILQVLRFRTGSAKPAYESRSLYN